MPKVSVIMGVYNGESYLEKAIDSILSQSFKDFEFLICDDGSIDKSIEIIKSYMKRDSRIKLLRNEKNLGLASSLNNCIKFSSGEYVARMDSDDIALEHRFLKQVKFLDENPQYAIVGGNAYLFNEEGIFGDRSMEKKFNKINAFKGNMFIHPTVMIRKKILIEVGGYTVEKFTYRTEDYDLWCKLALSGYKGSNLNEFLIYYREDSNSYTKRKFKYRVDSYRLRKKWFRELNIPFKYRVYIYKPLLAGVTPKVLMKKYHENKK